MRVNAGTDGAPGFTDELTQWSSRFNAAYRPFDALAVTAMVPLVNKTIHTVGDGTDVEDSNLTGLGDVEIMGRYAVWRSVNFGTGRVHEVALTAGGSAPTGPHDARDDAGHLIDPHGQLGTGAWSPFLGLHYRFERGDWQAFASASGRLRTRATYVDGSTYKFGDALLGSLHGQYRPTPAVALDLGLDWRAAKADSATDADGTLLDAVDNTGGGLASVAPGVYVNPSGKAWLFLRGQFPVFKRLLGEQDVLPSFTAGLQFQAL